MAPRTQSRRRVADNAGSEHLNARLRPASCRSRPLTASVYTDCHDNEIVCAISDARGIAPTVGIAFVNLSTSEAVLCQISDTQTFARTCHKLVVFSPSQIVFATTATESKLVSVIRENLNIEANDITMTDINRRYWSETVGHEYIENLAIPADLESIKLSAASSYYSVCCFAAAMSYIKMSMGVTIAPQNLRIRVEASEGAMMIDISTLTFLELVQNLLEANSKECLYGLLNTTRTRIGARFLKSNIVQPSTDRTKLLLRYEAVAELSRDTVLLADICQGLAGFVDTDKVLSALIVIQERLDFSFMEQSVNTVIMLKTFVDMIAPLSQALANATSKELQDIHYLCSPENYADLQDLLQYALNKDIRFSSKPTELRNQRVWALNAGVNEFLDVARQAFSEVGHDIDELVRGLRDQHNLNIGLKFDPARQYFISMKSAELEDRVLPNVFINVYQNKKTIECQTLDLVKLNQKLRDSHDEIIAMSNQSIQELISKARTKLHPLFKISEAIALLDMLAGFAELAVRHDYTQPDLIPTLSIELGRHPIREHNQYEKFIPNDVYATQQSRFQIITGCNMSGKSTYIRGIALMTVMAQIGCFVPAESATFPIVHQLFARLSMDDSIEANVSSFASEMQGMASILYNIEPRSLVIIDELGRGTSTNDGLAIAIATAEALIESKAMVWFVTHFRDLPRILAERAGVVSLHPVVDIEPNLSTMRMRYKINDGLEEQKLYGLALARLVNLPPQVIDDATSLSTQANKRIETAKVETVTLTKARKQKLVLKLREQLMQATESGNDAKAVRYWLRRLQEEFVIRMNMLDAEAGLMDTIREDAEKSDT